jgi:hypothetical protein
MVNFFIVLINIAKIFIKKSRDFFVGPKNFVQYLVKKYRY